MSGRAFVLGGGVAGITAALGLARAGWRVTLLEAHRGLGGRAFSVPDARLGGERDNGPHVLLGCYDEFRALLRRLGTEGMFLRARTLTVAYADAQGRRAALRLPRLPVPLAMPWALLAVRSMTWRERLRALLGLVGVIVGGRRHHTLADWLRIWRQHGAPQQHLWEPLCLAVMNAEPAAVSAHLFLKTMRQAFTGSAGRGAIWIPERPWSEIVGRPAARALATAGVEVVFGARVRSLQCEGDRVSCIAGEGFAPRELSADDVVVSALPWHRLAACLPSDDPIGARIARFAGRPIVSVYFALEVESPALEALPDEPLIALVGGAPFHFLVRRPSDPRHRFALLAGGTEAIDAMPASALIAAACAQVARHFPGVRVEPSQARVAKEARATLLADPATESLRPVCGPHPSLTNLRLAGDWCATGLPSTLEGAAWSGREATERRRSRPWRWIGALRITVVEVVVVLFALWWFVEVAPPADTFRSVRDPDRTESRRQTADHLVEGGDLFLRVRTHELWLETFRSETPVHWDEARIATLRRAHPELETLWPDPTRTDGGVVWLHGEDH